MKMDLESLKEEELIKLNEQIIKRLKELEAHRSEPLASQFKIGELVSFQQGEGREEAVIIRVNEKTVSVMTANYVKLVIFPELLIKTKSSTEKIRLLQSKLFPKR